MRLCNCCFQRHELNSTHSLALLNCQESAWGEGYRGKWGGKWNKLQIFIVGCNLRRKWWFVIHTSVRVCKLLLYCHLNQASVLYAMFPLTLFLQKNSALPLCVFFCFSNFRPSRCQTFPCVSADLACYLFQKITPTDQMAIGLPCPSYSSLDPQVSHVQTNTLPLFLIKTSR